MTACPDVLPADCFRLRSVVRVVSPTFELRIPELTIPAGQIFALLGPTGSGKSTLLRILGGLEPPTAGELLWQGGDLYHASNPPTARHDFTLVFQRPLPIRGSVQANVEYGLRLRGASDAAARAGAMLERLNLSPLAGQSAASLSGGQLQLVALARALVLRPRVLLLDEPTSHLDPAHVELVEREVLAQQQDQGMTVVWATHNLFQARRVAQHVALVLAGEIVEKRACDDFFNSATDSRTRDFVAGRMVC